VRPERLQRVLDPVDGQAVGVLEPWRTVSPYYQAIGRNPLHEGAPWSGWAGLAAAAAIVAAVAAWGLERRDLRQ